MADTQLVSVYWAPAVWELARSAYIADLDTRPDGPDSFTAWLAEALDRHAARTPRTRARLAAAHPAEAGEDRERGFQRAHPLPPATIAAFEDAIVADRTQTGRVLARSGFIREAVLDAVDQARTRTGGDLPPAPARLPTRPVRRRPTL